MTSFCRYGNISMLDISKGVIIMKIYNNDNFTKSNFIGSYTVKKVCDMYPYCEKIRVIDFGYFNLDDLKDGEYPLFYPEELDVRQFEQDEVVIAVVEKDTLICVI